MLCQGRARFASLTDTGTWKHLPLKAGRVNNRPNEALFKDFTGSDFFDELEAGHNLSALFLLLSCWCVVYATLG